MDLYHFVKEKLQQKVNGLNRPQQKNHLKVTFERTSSCSLFTQLCFQVKTEKPFLQFGTQSHWKYNFEKRKSLKEELFCDSQILCTSNWTVVNISSAHPQVDGHNNVWLVLAKQQGSSKETFFYLSLMQTVGMTALSLLLCLLLALSHLQVCVRNNMCWWRGSFLSPEKQARWSLRHCRSCRLSRHGCVPWLRRAIKSTRRRREHPWIKRVTPHILLTSNSGAAPHTHLSLSFLWQRQETLWCQLCKGSPSNVKFVCLRLSRWSLSQSVRLARCTVAS